MPMFTIVIPFHNSASTLGATLNSLIAQSCADWHAICVDDGSTDHSVTIARKYAARDPRIKIVANIGNGPSDARNYGASLATGTYLAFCDADDLWTPNKLAILRATFENGTADALYARIGFFSETPADCVTRSTVLDRPLQIADLLAENPVCTVSNLAVRTEVFTKIGGFDSDLVHNEDLEFLIRLAGEGHRIDGLNCVLVWYRTNANGLSANMDAMLEARQRVVTTAERYGVGPTRADDAVYMRYLARRALRLHAPHKEAWSYTREGLRADPVRFLTPLKRGLGTALASAVVNCVPTAARFVRP